MKAIQMTQAQFEALPRVKVNSSAGPCLSFYRFLRGNKKTTTVVFQNGDGYTSRLVRSRDVHTALCSLCSGGDSYPRGYQD